jgi:hypothetical protein
MKWLSENIKSVLAGLVIVASFTYYFVITFLERNADQQVVIAIITANATVLQYYFGSSQGANKKDEIISKQIDNKKDYEKSSD